MNQQDVSENLPFTTHSRKTRRFLEKRNVCIVWKWAFERERRFLKFPLWMGSCRGGRGKWYLNSMRTIQGADHCLSGTLSGKTAKPCKTENSHFTLFKLKPSMSFYAGEKGKCWITYSLFPVTAVTMLGKRRVEFSNCKPDLQWGRRQAECLECGKLSSEER